MSSTIFSSWHKIFISRWYLNYVFFITFSRQKKYSMTSNTLYFLAIVFVVLFSLFGSVWNNPTTGAVFQFFLCISIVVVGICYAIIGMNIYFIIVIVSVIHKKYIQANSCLILLWEVEILTRKRTPSSTEYVTIIWIHLCIEYFIN